MALRGMPLTATVAGLRARVHRAEAREKRVTEDRLLQMRGRLDSGRRSAVCHYERDEAKDRGESRHHKPSGRENPLPESPARGLAADA